MIRYNDPPVVAGSPGQLAALLPKHATDHIQRIVPRTVIVPTKTWDELGGLLRTHVIRGALIDPRRGADDTTAALGLIAQNPRAAIFAYVEPNARSLLDVFALSKGGLEDVFLHPVRANDMRFLNAMEKICGSCLASDVLVAIDNRVRALPWPVRRAVRDVFNRPRRYQTATDLANEAGVSVRSLYRSLEGAEFVTPRKLITMAKVIHACGYLRESQHTIRDVSAKLGYAEPEALSIHVRTRVGVTPARVRTQADSEGLLLSFIEELNKPRGLRGAR